MTRLNSEGKNQSKDPPNLDLVCTAYFSGVLCSLFSHIEISIFKTLFARKQSAKIFCLSWLILRSLEYTVKSSSLSPREIVY